MWSHSKRSCFVLVLAVACRQGPHEDGVWDSSPGQQTDTTSGANGTSPDSSGTLGTGDTTGGAGSGPKLDVSGESESGPSPDGLPNTCAEALAENSYIGCEYWGVTLANPELNYPTVGNPDPAQFHYGLAVANDTDEDAELNIVDGASIDNHYIVPANDMLVIEDLPWKEALRLPGAVHSFYYTRKVANAGYHITSSLPVTIYQFNPLDYEKDGDYSYSNDASLLLPAHVYRDEYMVVTRQSAKLRCEHGDDGVGGPSQNNLPGVLAVVGPAGGAVTVEITLTAHTRPSDGGSNETYAPHTPGQTLTTTIAPYEVLQVLAEAEGIAICSDATCPENFACNTPRQFDLTGTIVRVIDGPMPAVFGGHALARIPYATPAADHLEEQMIPLEAWGTRYLAAHHITQRPEEPAVWRVVSGSDENEITFMPVAAHAPVTLAKGEYIEFESFESFEVTGTGRTAVAQFMVGQNYTDPNNQGTGPDYGDPSMALCVPVEQYRKEYTFLAPPTYAENYLTVVHEVGAYPLLDGLPISGDEAAIASGFQRTNLEIGGGIHKMQSDSAFAIMVYGVGSATSYMYPGGLNLDKVDIPEG